LREETLIIGWKTKTGPQGKALETTIEVFIKEIVRSSQSTRIRAIRRPIEEDSMHDVFHVLPNKKVVNT
jgi:hypothetical protein